MSWTKCRLSGAANDDHEVLSKVLCVRCAWNGNSTVATLSIRTLTINNNDNARTEIMYEVE